MSRDRRESYRLPVAGVRALVETPGGSLEVALADLSAGGGSLILPAGREISTGTLRLVPPGRAAVELAMQPVRMLARDQHVITGVRFHQLDSSTLRALSRILIDRFGAEPSPRQLSASIGDFQRRRVRQVLRFHVLGHRQPLYVYSGDLALPLSLRGRELTVQAARQLLIAEAAEGELSLLEVGGTYGFAFSTGRAVSRFESQVFDRGAGSVALLLPPVIRQVGFRRSRRVPAESMRLDAPHPRLRGAQLVKTLLDVGGGGFSFAVDPEHDVLFPGESLAGVHLLGPFGDIELEARLRAVTRNAGTLTGRLEIVDFSDPADRSRWQQTVLAAAYHGVELGDRDSLDTVWEVLDSSGYLEETTAGLRDSLARSFFAAWRAHVEEPELARVLVIRRDQKPVGTVAANLVYPSTWMVHHFAIDEAERKRDRRLVFDVAEKVYCGMQLVLSSSPAVEHFIVYSDAAKGWHQLLTGDFLRRYSRNDDYLFDTFEVFKCAPADIPAPAADGSLRVATATPEHNADLAARLRHDLSEVELSAYGLGGADIELRHFSRWCARRDYLRERRILYALDGDRPVAAAVMELGDEGVNIFGLLNACWLVSLVPDTDVDERTASLLLRNAVRWYFEHGKYEVMYFARDHAKPAAALEQAGFSYVAVCLRFVARGHVLPAWMAHVDELMRMMRDG